MKKSKQPRELSDGNAESKAAKNAECDKLMHLAAGLELLARSRREVVGGRWWEGGVSQQLIGGTRWEELPPSSASHNSPTTRNDKALTHCDTLLSY